MPIKLALMVFKDASKYGWRLFRFYFIKGGVKGELITRSYMGFLDELSKAWGDTLVVVEKVYKWNRKSKKEWLYFTAEEQVAYVINKIVCYDAVDPSRVNIKKYDRVPSYVLNKLPAYFVLLGLPYSDYFTVSVLWSGINSKEKEAVEKMRKISSLLRDIRFHCLEKDIGTELYNYLKVIEQKGCYT